MSTKLCCGLKIFYDYLTLHLLVLIDWRQLYLTMEEPANCINIFYTSTWNFSHVTYVGAKNQILSIHPSKYLKSTCHIGWEVDLQILLPLYVGWFDEFSTTRCDFALLEVKFDGYSIVRDEKHSFCCVRGCWYRNVASELLYHFLRKNGVLNLSGRGLFSAR